MKTGICLYCRNWFQLRTSGEVRYHTQATGQMCMGSGLRPADPEPVLSWLR